MLWIFDRSRGVELVAWPPSDDRPHGVFATRSPQRPNPIGVTVVRLLSREGPRLRVRGVDMLDGTPIVDIKPYSSACLPARSAAAGSTKQKRAVARDPFDLDRFVQPQNRDYDTALVEIRNGRKQSHWMWYIFPQFEGLGSSAMSLRYAIKCCRGQSVLGTSGSRAAIARMRRGNSLDPGGSAREIFGSPDDLKLRSSATLFAVVSPDGSVFHRIVDRYFEGKQDPRTLELAGSRGALERDK